MTTTVVTIYHSTPDTFRNAMCDEWDQVQYHAVHHTILDAPCDDPEDDLGIAEQVWAHMNRGSGREWPILDTDNLRSMSVGDIVKLDDPDRGIRAYRAAALGFEAIEAWDIAPTTTPS
jgi:hypothetical protein